MYGCISSNFSLISSTNLKGQLIFITGYTLGWIGWPSPAYPTTWLVWFVAGHLFHISLIFCYSFKSNSISHTIHQLVIALVVSRPATIAFHLTATWLSIGLSWLVAGHHRIPFDSHMAFNWFVMVGSRPPNLGCQPNPQWGGRGSPTGNR